MDNKEMVKQAIDFHKQSFENCFSMMVTIQGQAEKLMKTFVDQTPGMSDEGKKVMNQWKDACKKGIDDFKKAIDEGYARVETFFDSNTTANFHDQAENMFNSYLNQANWMPPDLKKTMEDFTATYKKSCDEYKKYVDENVWRMVNFSPTAKKSQTKTKKKK
jgi:gas vesicle protein